QQQADSFAAQNVGDAAHDDSQQWWESKGGIDGESCPPDSCGTVTVRFQGGQPLFFAPVLGLGNNATVHGSAKAIWGPGAAEPEPIMIRFDWMSNECEEPVPNDHPPTECAFWLNDHDD